MFGQAFNFGAIAGAAKTLVDFLVVSGGGGSSDLRAGHIGGGGAGGILTSFGSNTPGTTGSIQPQLEISNGVKSSELVSSNLNVIISPFSWNSNLSLSSLKVSSIL